MLKMIPWTLYIDPFGVLWGRKKDGGVGWFRCVRTGEAAWLRRWCRRGRGGR